jgi:deoxyadenosine/deoxycytidine kinase
MTLLFICGPHGGGKTTLLKRLQQERNDIVIPELETRTPKFHTTPLERIRLKACERAIENYETARIAESRPESIVIGNRCIYDGDAYADVYRAHGWITAAEHRGLYSLARQVFPASLHNPRAIVLNPPFDLVRERLTGRWQSEQRKWREEDLEYCRLACEAYKRFKGKPGIYYMEDNRVDRFMHLYLDMIKDADEHEIAGARAVAEVEYCA